MDKLKLIIKREFIAKVRNKTFIIMTFLSPLLMIGFFALVAFLTKSGLEKQKTIAYVDNSQILTSELFEDTSDINYINLTDVGLDEAKKLTEENEYFGLLFIPKKDSLKQIADNLEFYSKDSPSMMVIEDLEYKIENKLYHLQLARSGIDYKILEASKMDASIKLTTFSGEQTSKLIGGLKIGIGMGAGYLIMMFIIIYGAMVMRSVIEEKTSRIIEVIISSVKPFQLMLGKVIGTALAGLLQFFIWSLIIGILMIGASLFFGVDMMEMQTSTLSTEQVEAMSQMASSEGQLLMQEILKLPLFSIFMLFIAYFLGGYLLYSSIYAAIGAAVDNETDTQQFMLPVILPLMLGVYIGFASVISEPHGTIATVFSMIPFTSPIVMLMRIPFGVPWWQITISLALLLLTFLIIVWFAAKIYRVGILMYGKKPSYKELYKWLKY